MDEQNQPANPAENQQPTTDSQPTEPAAPAALSVTVTTGEPTAAPEPASPPPAAPEQPAPAPTAGGDSGQPPQITTSDGNKKSHRGLWVTLLVLIVVAGLAVVGYVLTRPQSSTTVVKITKTSAKKDVPVIQVAGFSPLPHTYYPNVQNDNYQSDITMQTFEALTKFENGTVLKPGLAASWTNPDSSTWVFKLRSNVSFHTGKTLTASDVKASIAAIQSTDYGKVYASTIKSVDVIDPLTVKITTNGPDPLLANELTGVFIFDTTSGKKNDPINGSGPYTLKSDTADKVSLAAYDKYWGGHVYTREVDYLNYGDGSQVPTTDLKALTPQVMAIVGDQTFADSLKTYGYTVTNLPSYQVAHLVFNTLRSGSPFAQVKVRQAIAQAVDKQALAKAADAGDASDATQTIPEGIPGYNPAIKALTHDQTAAKAALAAAGYPHGFSFKFTYYSKAQTVADELKKEMAAIGVTVTEDPESDQQQLVKIAIGGGTDMYYNLVSSNYVDGSDILSDFIDSPNYTNKALDALNTKASQELDQAKRVAILQQMGKLVEDDQADVPLYQRHDFVFAQDPKLVIQRDTIATSVGTYFWQTYAK